MPNTRMQIDVLPPIVEGLGERLKEARNRLGLKQNELAEFGRVSRTAQVRYEAGTTSPSVDYLQGIQNAGIDLSFVLFGKSSHDDLEAMRLREIKSLQRKIETLRALKF